MHGRFAGLVLTMAVVAAAACAPSPTPPPQPVSVGPYEHFRGVVNGAGDGVVVNTVCGGATWPGRSGPVVAGQTVEVRQDPSGSGLTDRSGTLFARTDGSGDVRQVTAYATPTLLDGLFVPCDGTGLIVFDPCYGIIGCIEGGRADSVRVKFVNVAL